MLWKRDATGRAAGARQQITEGRCRRQRNFHSRREGPIKKGAVRPLFDCGSTDLRD
jgi:hypothetical protein